MSSADDYGKRQREPVFSVRDGKAGRVQSIALDGPRDLDEAGVGHLRKVQEAIRQLQGPEPPTRLQAIAELLALLPYGDMMEFAGGAEADAAKLFAWAMANLRRTRDAS